MGKKSESEIFRDGRLRVRNFPAEESATDFSRRTRKYINSGEQSRSRDETVVEG